jgi:hypothetical protein
VSRTKWPSGVIVGRTKEGDVTLCTFDRSRPYGMQGHTVQLSREEAKIIAEDLLWLASAE